MPKAGELDWSHLYEKGSIERPEHPLSKSIGVKKGAKGADILDKQFSDMASSIIKDTPRQPTDEEMFGHLVVTEEQVKKAEHDWENKINGFYEAAAEPIDKLHKNREWGSGKSFKDKLSPEELAAYEKGSSDFDSSIS